MRTGGRSDRQTYRMKLILGFRRFANESKNRINSCVKTTHAVSQSIYKSVSLSFAVSNEGRR
jgi:hypothetical protein